MKIILFHKWLVVQDLVWELKKWGTNIPTVYFPSSKISIARCNADIVKLTSKQDPRR